MSAGPRGWSPRAHSKDWRAVWLLVVPSGGLPHGGLGALSRASLSSCPRDQAKAVTMSLPQCPITQPPGHCGSQAGRCPSKLLPQQSSRASYPTSASSVRMQEALGEFREKGPLSVSGPMEGRAQASRAATLLSAPLPGVPLL